MITQKIEQDEIFRLLGVPQQAIEKKRNSVGSLDSADFEDTKKILQEIKIKCFEDLQEIQKRYEAASQVLDSIEKFYATFSGLKSSKKEQRIEQRIEQPIEQRIEQPIEQRIEQSQNNHRIVVAVKYPNCYVMQKLAKRSKPFDYLRTRELKDMMGYVANNTVYATIDRGTLATQQTLTKYGHGYCRLTPLGEAKVKEILEEKSEIIFAGKCAFAIVNDVLAKGYTTQYRIYKLTGYNGSIVSSAVSCLQDESCRNLLQQGPDGKIRMADWTKGTTVTVK
jgi:hypothetical protein